jgi:hypothetical protein
MLESLDALFGMDLPLPREMVNMHMLGVESVLQW